MTRFDGGVFDLLSFDYAEHDDSRFLDFAATLTLVGRLFLGVHGAASPALGFHGLNLGRALAEYQRNYNVERVYASIGASTPAEFSGAAGRIQLELSIFGWKAHCGTGGVATFGLTGSIETDNASDRDGPANAGSSPPLNDRSTRS